MVRRCGISRFLVWSAVAAATFAGIMYAASVDTGPTNDAPNPYRTIEHWAKLPEGRKIGSTSAVDIDKDGKAVWVAERCGANSCLDRSTGEIKKMDVIFKFDTNGNVLKSFGSGMFIAPHGIYVDKDDNIWVTVYQDNAPLPQGSRGRGAGRGAPPEGPIGPPPGATKGHQVFKFSNDGKLLMAIGKPGGAAEPECCYAPNDVIVAKNGDIFISEGHFAPPLNRMKPCLAKGIAAFFESGAGGRAGSGTSRGACVRSRGQERWGRGGDGAQKVGGESRAGKSPGHGP